MTKPVSDQMRLVIQEKLREIAREENALILFAAESGSRAWGFHSHDSDYDVRFVYARPVDWHLSVGNKRDVIERPISDELDLSGWELSKSLLLALKSNAVISEWLQSPIVYHVQDEFDAEMMAYCRSVLTRKNVTWHYLNLTARQTERLKTPEGEVRLKRYLYCLRPAFALRWMRLHENAVPPMDMTRLMDAIDLPAAVRSYIDKLIEIKRDAGELGVCAETDAACDALIADEVSRTHDWLGTAAKPDRLGFDAADAINRKYTRLAGN